jgi:hypothetical protein
LETILNSANHAIRLYPASSRAQSRAHDHQGVARFKYKRYTYWLERHDLKNPRCMGFTLPGVMASASMSAEEGRFYKYPEEKEVKKDAVYNMRERQFRYGEKRKRIR